MVAVVHLHAGGEMRVCVESRMRSGACSCGGDDHQGSARGDRGRQAEARAQCWAQQRAAYRHILALMEGGTFTVGRRPVLDAETLDEVRQWAARRVAACEARLAARDQDH